MDLQNIKDYINKALALEKAIFIQEELMKEHSRLLDNRRKSLEKDLPALPHKPVKHTVGKENVIKKELNPVDYAVEEPIPPRKPKLDTKDLRICLSFGIIILVFTIYCFGLGLILRNALYVLGGIACFCGSVFLFREPYLTYSLYRFSLKVSYPDKLAKYREEKRLYPELVKQAKERYERDVARQEQIYEDSLKGVEKRYRKNLKESENTYKKKLDNYNAEIEKYNSSQKKLESFEESSTAILSEHTELLSMLKQALKEHYSSNILYPKYQYFVAVASISEYLSSGRCDSLEGANGAYNLYEAELRQNLIINQLSSLLGNIEQAKCNQYLLYKELMDAREIVRRISVSISSLPEDKNTTLNSYISSTLNLIGS